MSEYVVRGAVPNHTVRVEDEREVYWHMTHLPVLEEIVRCKDCKFRSKACCWCIGGGANPSGFCAWGERRNACD
jgi:hypothetical protein